MPARVVIGSASDQADQQGDVLRLQPVQWLVKIVQAGAPESVHRVSSLLAEEYLVEVCLQDLSLVIMKFQQQGHDRLIDFPRDGTLIRQEIVLDQLLRERTATLNGPAGLEVGQCCPGDALEIHPGVMLKIPVFYCLQAGQQQGRYMVDSDQRSVFFVQGVNGRNFRGFQSNQVQRSPRFHVAYTADFTGLQLKRKMQSVLDTVMEAKRAPVYFHCVAGNAIQAWSVSIGLAQISGNTQFEFEVFECDWQTRVQVKRTRVDPARQVPFAPFEFSRHLVVQVGGPGHQQTQAYPGDKQRETPDPAKPARDCFVYRRTAPGASLFPGSLFPADLFFTCLFFEFAHHRKCLATG